MLSYALAIAVALSSLVLFLTAFLMSDIHRRDDFLWSGVGLFYALVLWFCARNITGAVLLGQVFASVLLISFVWQTLKLRKAIANPEQAAAINNFSILQAVNNLSKRNQPTLQTTVSSPEFESANVVTESKISIPQTTSTEVKLPISDNNTSSKKANKLGSFNKLFGNKKKATITNTKLDDILDDQEVIETEPTAVKSSLNSLESQPIARETIPDSLNEEKKEIKNPESPETVNPTPEDTVVQVVSNDSPEVVQPEIIEKESVVNSELNTSNSEKKVEIEPENFSQAEATTQEISPSQSPAKNEHDLKPTPGVSKIDQIDQIEVNPEENTPTEVIAEVKVVKSTIKVSSLDSLETVEVAEILEALPENKSGERNSDKFNIIEVTTTEINQIVESEQSAQNPNSEET